MTGTTTMPPTRRTPRRHGVSLVELMVVLVVASILLAVAVPSWRGNVARARLEGAMQELALDLAYARSEALRRAEPVRLSTAADGQRYTLATVSGTTLKVLSVPPETSLTPSVTLEFDGVRGALAEDGHVDASSSGIAASLRASVTVVGRVRVCAPSGGMPGYTTC